MRKDRLMHTRLERPVFSGALLRNVGRALGVVGFMGGFVAMNYLFYGPVGLEHASQIYPQLHATIGDAVQTFAPGLVGGLFGMLPGGVLNGIGEGR